MVCFYQLEPGWGLSRAYYRSCLQPTIFCSYVVINATKLVISFELRRKFRRSFVAWTRMRWISRDSALSRWISHYYSSIVSFGSMNTVFLCIAFAMKYTLYILLYSASIAAVRLPLRKLSKYQQGNQPIKFAQYTVKCSACLMAHFPSSERMLISSLDAVSRTMPLSSLHGWWCRLFSFHKWSYHTMPPG